MKLAFYAPLKSPHHGVPSGDRAMARALIKALEMGGATVTLASELRTRESDGNRAAQEQILAQANAQLPDIITKGRAEGWQAWITYHNYYKAPDLIGPAASAALGIPYMIIEATRARKRLEGAWAAFAAQAEAACDAADVIFYLTNRDAEALKRDAPKQQSLVHLPPFLNRDDLPGETTRIGPMLSVGMMRAGDKLASYQLIADTLALITHPDWQLDIVGDGAARPRVEALMARFGSQVTFRGHLNEAEVATCYAKAPLLFWPGVNEAFGMTYLEAQAAGVPVIAQDRPGVCDVVYSDGPAPRQGPRPMADKITQWLAEPKTATTEGKAARAQIAAKHLRPTATAILMRALRSCIETAA